MIKYNNKLVVYTFLLSFIIISILSYLLIDTRLIFHHQQIAWDSSAAFFNSHFSKAGGPAEYIALFITQLFFYNFSGSFVISLVVTLITFVLYSIIKLKWGDFYLPYFILPFIPVILIALMFNYNYHFSITVNLFIVSNFLLLGQVINIRFKANLLIVTLLAGLWVYYLSGGIYFLLFMLSSIVLHLHSINKASLINIAVILFVTVLIPFVAFKFVFLTSLKMSYFRAYPEVAVMLRYNTPPLFYIGLGIIPFMFTISAIFYRTSKKEKTTITKKTVNQRIVKKPFLRIPIQSTKIIAVIIVWLLCSTIILITAFNPSNKLQKQINYLAFNEKWDEVLEMSKKVKNYNRDVNFQFNRALLHTGKLLDDLFSYEQLLGVQGLFLDIPFTSEVALPNSDLYFDLGVIDESQRFAFEAQTLMPNSPRVLKRLTQNSVIMENSAAATTFINVLSANPVEKKWVGEYYELLQNKEKQQHNKLIAEKRAFMNKAEGLKISPRDKMLSLLQQNPENKFAFEYLIAFDLMEHDLSSFIKDLTYIKNFEYQKTPRAIEEAILLFASQRSDLKLPYDFNISPNTVNQFREFASITRANAGNRTKAKLAAIEYKNTYWYYVLFLSPLVTNVKLETHPTEANY
ncbi:MAG: hypothetical protein JXR61_09765 [Prolixibacteraceae bacterium]|nr:hypothetical protein [Prolixibacteraceae bacterium]